MNAGWQADLFEKLAERAVSATYRELWRGQAAYWRAREGGSCAGDSDNITPKNQQNLNNKRKDTNNQISAVEINLDLSPARVPPSFRAKNEPAWARVFSALGLAWKYEALEPELSRGLRYQPDFWLIDRLAWVEIKSAPPSEGEIRVARALRQVTASRVYILAGWPGHCRYSVSLFSESGDFVTTRPDWCNVALCVLFDCSFAALLAAFTEATNG